MASVPEQITRVQLIANTPAQTIFTYPFLILDEEDIEVFQAGTQLNLGTQYTVTGVGNDTGGTIVLVTGVAIGTLMVLNRNMAIERVTDFTTGGEFTGNAINLELDRLTMISQEIETELERRGLTYPVTTNLQVDRQQNILPSLVPNSGNKLSIWSRANAGGLVALQIDEGADVNTLRSELASETQFSDGSLLVGYFDTAASIGKTVHVKLDEIDQITADFSNNTTHADSGSKLVGYNAASNATNVRDELDVLGNTRSIPLSAVLNGSIYNATIPGSIFPFTSYNEDSVFKIKFDLTNPGAVSLNINAIGAFPIREADGKALPANFFAANESVLLYFNAGASQFRILSNVSSTSTSTLAESRAWVYWNGGASPVIRKSFNVSTVQRIAKGDYRITFANTMDSAFYAVSVNGDEPLTAGASLLATIRNSRTTTRVDVSFLEFTSATWSNEDVTGASVVIYGIFA